MDSIIKKVLKKIENSGYEAYIVGGYVRDYIMGKKAFDIDICTNAVPKELNKIFPNCLNTNYGGISFKIKKYNFDITTYRKEIKYESRKPIEIEYINNLLDDINRRDFKINAICMNSKGTIIDIINGRDDIKNHLVSMIGDPTIKFREDPLRILRAIRFSTVLNFDLEKNLEIAISNEHQLVHELSDIRIKEELDKILLSSHFIKGLSYLKDLGILDVLNIKYDNIIRTNDILGIWAQLEFSFNDAFTKEEKNNIINIRKILDYGKIDNYILYKYGLYLSMVAGEILGYDRVYINKLFKQLPIHSKKDIDISAEQIMNILNVKPGEIISLILDDITLAILQGIIKNSFGDIKKYVLQNEAELVKNEFKKDIGN